MLGELFDNVRHLKNGKVPVLNIESIFYSKQADSIIMNFTGEHGGRCWQASFQADNVKNVID